jgi:hypothetical protein
MEPLTKGQQVTLKVVKLKGTVTDSGRPDPDAGLGEGGTIYQVHFPEQTMFVLRENLATLPEPDRKIHYGSKEWNTELERFTELAGRWQASSNDRSIFRELVESGSRLGFFIPIGEETK